MKVSEIFYSVQGEIDIGKPAIFIRLSGCNLIRENKVCEFCDSLYAEQGEEITITDVLQKVKSFDCRNVVITGGEPLYQLEDLIILVQELDKEGYSIDIETNGTIFSDDVFWNCFSINCSPKRQAINIDVLKRLLDFNTRFKFIYENKEDMWWEQVIEEVGIRSDTVYIMPQGKTREEQLKLMPEVIEYCKLKGYNFTPRLHVLVWDNRRGV